MDWPFHPCRVLSKSGRLMPAALTRDEEQPPVTAAGLTVPKAYRRRTLSTQHDVPRHWPSPAIPAESLTGSSASLTATERYLIRGMEEQKAMIKELSVQLKALQQSVGHVLWQSVSTPSAFLPGGHGAAGGQVAKFSTVGGAILDKRIANTLKTLLNDSFAANLNFCGKGEKRAFKGTHFQLVVNDAVRKAPIFASAGDGALQ
ncbi:hypothetical protein CAPTEDRAFT_185623 [Capitella teleta]|uniref:DUF4806 domain-containing protein n=1 Tax=Capitella teleta TaxID=283909 RepID=R7UBT1_CAPTE|nr:hypothetical protein CAPTEDRAFT_185623 [Capitella teleta]|eukprot:ELU03561.1 hypothetical protein CAPTEDRAFT_185623 [Capitella teleta]